jgi:branched-chain amino acid transport system substrate-binding protein
MKLAGTTTDAAAIRAKLGEALSKLPSQINAGNFGGIDAAGATVVTPVVATVEGGKLKLLRIDDLMK